MLLPLNIFLAFKSTCGIFLWLSNPPTMLLTSAASSSSCCVAASRSLRIHSFHETGQSQSSIQAVQAKREGKRSAPCWAIIWGENREARTEQGWHQDGTSRNPAQVGPREREVSTLHELGYCQQNKWEQTPHTIQARVSPEEGKRADVSKILSRANPGEKEGELKLPTQHKPHITEG